MNEVEVDPGSAFAFAAADAAARERFWSAERRLALRTILIWWAASRAVVVAAVSISELARWPREGWYVRHGAHPLSVLGAWDGRWYRMLAQFGYVKLPHGQSDTAFFPLYPFLIRAAHSTGLSYGLAAILLANAAFIVALSAVYELARTWLPQQAAIRTAVYAAVFPLGFVFSMEYPEALELACIALTGIFAWRGRWLLAATAAAASVLTRPEGAFLVLPLAALALHAGKAITRTDRWRVLVALLAVPATLVGLAVGEWQTVGDPLAYSHAQLAWGRQFSLTGIYRTVAQLMHPPSGQFGWLLRDAGCSVLYLFLLLVARRAGIPRSWAIAGCLIVLLPLASGSFNSDARFGLVVPPVYCGLASIANRPWKHALLVAISLGLLGISAATIPSHWP